MYKESVYLNFIKYLFILLILSIIALIYTEIKRNNKLKNKFDNITVKPLKENDSSIKLFLDNIISIFDNVLISFFSKFKIVNEYAKKFDKYSIVNDYSNILTFIRKIEVGLLCSLLYLIISILELYSFSIAMFLIIFIFSSYLLELSLYIKLQIRNIRVKESIYDAINTLNMAFKSGKTITGSIEYVIHEVDGPVKEEFKNVLNDINHGLSINESFDRMRERTNIKELEFICSAIALLSVTGGDITSVFEMINNELTERKKLNAEYNSITSSSRFTYKILLVLPLILTIVLTILNKNFFYPLISTFVGVLVLIIIISLYLLYILLINKIFKGGITWE